MHGNHRMTFGIIRKGWLRICHPLSAFVSHAIHPFSFTYTQYMQGLKFIYIFQKYQRKPEHSVLAKEEIHVAFLNGIHDNDTMALYTGQHCLRVSASLGIGTFFTDRTGVRA